ncbi:uncharacterized protein LOC115440292 isoform X1 [Manduca sexta]|uniref:uncharacterized protein LOC115440292 isoform X1 n=1 Tax=Manduca sexta TaxID=7130 RepID=UPI00189088E0|nr:uncharacterized protein LOC115440292 isoform X1 [Manduca sexta]
MRGDDDEEEESSVNATRYPCMPSLVALQQMRNRLHLAHLGKKLMKWTAMATGRELRRLAGEIDETYKNFAEDMRSAFMLLARGRYFYPNMNNTVLENVALAACVTVATSSKSISGVKVLQLEVIETGFKPYPHLGIEKGGQTIQGAKKAWLDLLKRLIIMLQQRTSFYQLEQAHKSATKRWNVLRKIVIPRLKNTIKYVICEIDEIEREDMFRLKRFKQMKTKRQKDDAGEHVCSCCRSMFAADKKIIETVCPLCKTAEKIKPKPSELKLNIVPCKSEDNLKENKKRLEHLMSHIDDVIDLSKQYKMEGIISPSIEKFIRSCSQVKEKIEDYANAQPLCDLCRKALGSTGKISASKIGTSESMNLPCSSDRPTEEPPCFDSTYNLTPETDDKLGHFEKKFKEIVKITRLQNEDGTISEEKQVITIKTERRNPRKPKNFDATASSEMFDNGGGGGGYGGDSRSSYHPGPKQAKSEHCCRSQQMSEPKLRSCMSEYHPKSSPNKDEVTYFDGGYCFSVKNSRVTLPPEATPQKGSGKMSVSTSLETCCPKKSASVCGGELSQSYLQGLQKAVSNASVQACCKEIKVKKSIEDRGTCCLPTCKGDEDCPDKQEKQDEKIKTTATDAVWRDTWTSSTDLNTTPSKATSLKSPGVSFNNKDPNKDSDQDESFKRAESCCTIKIIMKPPKVCSFEEKLAKKKQEAEAQKEVVLGGSMFESLKRMILPSYPSPSQIEPTSELEIKNICKNCISKLQSGVPSQKSSMSSKRCQVEVVVPEKTPSCPSCGTLAMSQSSDVASNKSIGVGSCTEYCITCTKSPTPSMHSQKHICCLSKMSSDTSFVSTCCDVVEGKSQKSVCCAKSKSSTAPCFRKDSATSGRSSVTNVCSKDAATCTKRSTRFDVRPMRKKHTCEKISMKDCSCKSDPCVPRKTCNYYKHPRKCQSLHDNDYYYFRW